MSLLIISNAHDLEAWEKALLNEDDEIDIEIWPNISEPEKVQFAITWNHPEHSLDNFPNLKAVSSMGAGVNHILNDETVPDDVNICRIVDNNLISRMTEYLYNAVSNYRLHTFEYYQQEQNANWKRHHPKSGLTVGVMGLGKLGLPAAKRFTETGYEVAGWSNSSKDIGDIQTFAGADELDNFLGVTNVLICLLPLTSETEDILDLALFKKMNQPAFVINAGRGGHLVEEDLIYALDRGYLDGAQLDVFKEEPLPEKHSFWNRENIIITPHVAAETEPASVAPQIIENYKRTLSGMPLKNEVDVEKGY